MSQGIKYIFECIVKLFLVTVGRSEGIEVSTVDAIVGLISAFVGIVLIIHAVCIINWIVYRIYMLIHNKKKKHMKNNARPIRDQVRILDPHE